MLEHQKKILDIACRLRSEQNRTSVYAILKQSREAGIEIDAETLSFALNQYEPHCEALASYDIARFVAELFKPNPPRSLLDVWGGEGLLSLHLNATLNPEKQVAYVRSERASELWSTFNTRLMFLPGEPLGRIRGMAGIFQGIVGFPPLNVKSQNASFIDIEGDLTETVDDYGHLLILEACRNLSPDGTAVFIVGNKFFHESESPGKTLHTLARLGIRPVAAIEIPAGTLSPHLMFPTHIAVLRKSDAEQMFTGRYSADEKQQKILLANFRKGIADTTPVLGQIVDTESFGSFTAIDFAIRLEESARRHGFVPYKLCEVVKEVNTPSLKNGKRFEEKSNSVYLPQMASTLATTNQDELPEKLNSYFQLVIDPELADSEFVAGLLNTSFGQLWRDSLRSGSVIPRISKGQLQQANFYLPPKSSRKVQADVVSCHNHITRLRSEINELEFKLWQKTKNVLEIQRAIQTINREDRFENWVDSLPFPLASILWSCHTQSGSLKEQYERKINFFEALGEFIGVIYLSAFSANSSIWYDLKSKLVEALSKGKLSLELATFGTWKVVVEYLSKVARDQLARDEELIFELFKTRNRELLNSLFSKRLASILQDTNKIRNDRLGHSGIVADKEAQQVNEQLHKHIQSVREIFGIVWGEYELLLPGECKLKSGTYEHKVKVIMGSRTPFPTGTVAIAEAMEDAHLYLKSPDETRGLKLLPLIKVMPSPRTEENACYFYNRCQPNGIRFLSYYFEADSEIIGKFGDVAVVIHGILGSQ